MSEAEDMIVVDNVVKRFDPITALQGVSLQVKRGETFGLLGPNGAGKTTLVSILSTMVRPTEGDATIGGASVSRDPEAVRRLLGVVFQRTTLDPVMSATENLRIHGKLYKVPKRDLEARIPELLELVGLTDRADHEVRTYSGGMRRRLELVRAVIHRPRVLLLDEPTVALDPQSRRVIWEHIANLRKEHEMTVLVTTHYMDEADALCDRVAIIDHGQLTVVDAPAALKAQLGGDTLDLLLEGPAVVPEGLDAVAGVISAFVKEDRVLVRLRDPETTIPRVLGAFHRAGHAVAEMKHRPSSLDDVFLDRTGKAPRDKSKKKRGWFAGLLGEMS